MQEFYGVNREGGSYLFYWKSEPNLNDVDEGEKQGIGVYSYDFFDIL